MIGLIINVIVKKIIINKNLKYNFKKNIYYEIPKNYGKIKFVAY